MLKTIFLSNIRKICKVLCIAKGFIGGKFSDVLPRSTADTPEYEMYIQEPRHIEFLRLILFLTAKHGAEIEKILICG